MSYIDQINRDHIGDEMINGLISAIKSAPSGKWEANCVYVIMRIVLGVMVPRSWTEIKRCKGIFSESYDEIQRRLQAPREIEAIAKNRDLREFQQLLGRQS